MNLFRIALANLRFSASPMDSVRLATDAVIEAGSAGAGVVRFPEYFVPGYRAPDGTLLCSQPYGREGLSIADVDLDESTCLLARRIRE